MYRQGAETALYRTEISKRNSLGNLLYKSVSNVNSFEGVTSGLNTVKLDSSSDRIGTFYLKNLVQTTQSSGGRNGRRLSVSLSSSYAEFKNVGEYDADPNVGLTFNDGDCEVTWPGGGCIPPVDAGEEISSSGSSSSFSTFEIIYMFVAPSVLGVTVLTYCVYRYELIRSRKKYELKHTREKEVIEKQNMITLEKRRVELVSMVQRQNAAHRESYTLIAPWSLSKKDIKLIQRNKTNDTPSISLYDGEVVINGSIYECLIKVYVVFEREVFEREAREF